MNQRPKKSNGDERAMNEERCRIQVRDKRNGFT
jgi:hypothetical protein